MIPHRYHARRTSSKFCLPPPGRFATVRNQSRRSFNREVDVRFATRIALFAVLCIAIAGPVAAQSTGQYAGAAVLEPGGHLVGGYFDVSSHVVGLMSQLRLSFYPGVDFGFQGGLARDNVGGGSKGIVRLGTDIKFATHRARADAPFDLAFGGLLGVESGDNYSTLSLGPSVVVSRAFKPGQSGGIAPYIGAALLYAKVDENTINHTNVSVPLRFGAEINATPAARLVAEFQWRIADDFHDETNISVGVNVPF
jgi:hypothetical protein